MTETARTTTRADLVLAGCIAVATALLAFVATIAPQNVLSQYRFLQNYTELSGAVIPAIGRLAAVSSFPEVTSLVVSVMWTLVPVFTAVFFFKVRVPENFVGRSKQRPFFLTFAIIIFAGSIVLLAVLYEITPDDLVGGLMNETVLRTISTSRIGLGLIGGFFAAGIALMTYAVLIWLLSLPRIYFSRRRGNGL